jgi:hypothetical protein
MFGVARWTKSPVRAVAVGGTPTSSLNAANPIIFIMMLIAIRMNRKISFPAFDRNQMLLAQKFTGTKRGRAAEAVIIQNPQKLSRNT